MSSPAACAAVGNAYAYRLAALRHSILDAVSPEDIRDIFVALVVKAKTGQADAGKLVLQYVFGKPPAMQDLERIHADDQVLLQMVPPPPQGTTAHKSNPAPTANGGTGAPARTGSVSDGLAAPGTGGQPPRAANPPSANGDNRPRVPVGDTAAMPRVSG